MSGQWKTCPGGCVYDVVSSGNVDLCDCIGKCGKIFGDNCKQHWLLLLNKLVVVRDYEVYN